MRIFFIWGFAVEALDLSYWMSWVDHGKKRPGISAGAIVPRKERERPPWHD
jgi:hypothetical protein